MLNFEPFQSFCNGFNIVKPVFQKKSLTRRVYEGVLIIPHFYHGEWMKNNALDLANGLT